ncbi:hypothetical protein SAMD00023353_3100960 [Rosellinia necatrix]|uniref:J domain-containing protein n=1 Tax=Rosellinia necatrix TaxID=77044 RepID=A0A1W2TSJ3_ROSNE|nr:hypothetical protein SAMD00023353_3100960 [Rosellinia necatrix]
MKFSTLAIGLVALLTPLTAAWSKEDREIFRVRDELTTHEGPEVTFYDFLGVTPSATQDEINKAYKRKSRALHPDKVRQQIMADRTKQNKAKGIKVTKSPTQSEIKAAVKKASERQTRLSIVTNVLRGAGRERYDHFLKNGFPTWKGTEYYYNRYRPGLGTVLFGCLLVGGGGFHYLALYMSWRRQREFIERYIRFARDAAWGDNFAVPGLDATPPPPPPPQAAAEDDQQQQPPIALNRKQRRMQEKETRKESAKDGKRPSRAKGKTSQQASGSATPVPQTQPQSTQGPGPTGAKKRVVAQNGKILVVDSLGDVYLEQEDEDGNVHEFLLDPEEFPPPTVKDTALFKLPGWVYALTVGRVLGGPTPSSEADGADDHTDDDDEADSDPAQRTPSTDSADDFELLEKSVDSLSQSKATGTQAQQGGSSGKAKKRNNKKR